MSEESPGARAVATLEISDVFVVEAHGEVVRDFNPTHQLQNVVYQHRLHTGAEGLVQSRIVAATGQEIYFVRYYVEGGVRILKQEAASAGKDAAEVTADDVLAEIRATLAVDYQCPPDFWKDSDAIGSFNKNAIFHAYPYWRELVHSIGARMRLPRITLPMMKPSLKTSGADAPAEKNTQSGNTGEQRESPTKTED